MQLLAFNLLFFRDVDLGSSVVHDRLSDKAKAKAVATKMETFCAIGHIPCNNLLNIHRQVFHNCEHRGAGPCHH